MKIFNWMHRKLNGQPSSVPLHPQKGEVKMSQLNIQVKQGDDDTEALLGWRDGLLAIGTLGLLTNHHPHADYIMIPNLNAFDYYKGSVDIDVEYVDEQPKLMEEVTKGVEDDEMMPLVFNVYNSHEIEEEVDEKKVLLSIKTNDVTDVKESNEKGDRTTLADLFKAEAVASQTCVGKSVSILKENNYKKDDEEIAKHKKFPVSSLSGKLVKKLIPSHDAQPIKKINHMMRKMMKRKIHPELLHQKSANGVIIANQIDNDLQVYSMALLHPEIVVVD